MPHPKTYTATDLKLERHRTIYRLWQKNVSQRIIAHAVGLQQPAVSLILKRIRQAGGLESYQVGQPSGRPQRLSSSQIDQLKAWLQKAPSQLGFPKGGWTRRRVASLIKSRFGIEYSLCRISQKMNDWGFTLQHPEIRDSRQASKLVTNYECHTLRLLKKS